MSSKLSIAKVAGHIDRISTGVTLEKSDRKLVIPSHRELKRFDSIEEYSECVKKNMWSDSSDQSRVKYPTYKDWLENWLFKVVDKATSKLNKKGRIVIWIGHSDEHDIAEDFLAESYNTLSLEDIIRFEMPKSSYHRRVGDSYRIERIFVMSRKKK